MKIFIIKVLIFIILFCFTFQSFARGEAAFDFFLISPFTSPSPIANGMGNTYIAYSPNDAMAPIFNPAYLGMFAQENFFSLGFYPKKADLRLRLFEDINYNYNSGNLNLGFNFKNIKKNIPLSVGLGFNTIKLDYGEHIRTDESMNVIGTVSSFNQCKSVIFSVSLDFYIKASIGLSFNDIEYRQINKDIESRIIETISVNANAKDFGIIFQLPILETLHELTNISYSIIPGLSPFLLSTFGYSKNNVGDDVTYIGIEQSYPLPRVARIGFSFNPGLCYSKENLIWKLLSLKLAKEAEDELIQSFPDGTFNYRKGLGDINFFHDLILGKSNGEILKRNGFEFDLFEICSFRKGNFKGIDYEQVETEGFGISITGVYKAVRLFYPTIADKSVAFIIKHVDIRYDYSVLKANSRFNEIKFHGININIF